VADGLDVLVIPLLTVNLTNPNWLATGGSWVETLHRVMAFWEDRGGKTVAPPCWYSYISGYLRTVDKAKSAKSAKTPLKLFCLCREIEV